MAELATLNGFMAATQAEVALPAPCQALLHRETVTVRRIPASLFGALFPFLPAAVVVPGPEEEALSKDERAQRFRERENHWLETVEPSVRVRYRVDQEQVKFRALAMALVAPKMTAEEVERLGDDITPVYVRLLEISGLLVKPETAPSEAPSA